MKGGTGMTASALVTVIVPTHSHDETLGFSVRSILGQTMTDLEVVVIGDGVTDAVRSVAADLCRLDGRVRFLDEPKSPRRGELFRDGVIRDSASTYVAYNCDDDLWFPHHLESMIATIGDRDFVHPLPILIGADGVPFHMPCDLSRPESVRWHLGTIPRNTISLSGVLHTRESYLRLPHGWRETPEGRWTDHYMWQQFFEQEWFSGVTASTATTLKLMAQGRDDLPPGARRADIESWWNRLHDPRFGAEWDELVRDAVRSAAVNQMLAATEREDALVALQSRVVAAERDLAQAGGSIAELKSRIVNLRTQLRSMKTSRSWRVTRPLRAVRGWIRHHR